MTDRELIERLRSADHMHAATKLLCDEAADRLEALASRPDGWRGIESAPKDGTQFDVWRDGERFTDCFWKNGCVQQKNGYPAVWTVFRPPPTHWMPLPPAPQPE